MSKKNKSTAPPIDPHEVIPPRGCLNCGKDQTVMIVIAWTDSRAYSYRTCSRCLTTGESNREANRRWGTALEKKKPAIPYGAT